MNTAPELEYTNCCQPWHDLPTQVEVVKKFVLSWSEKVLATGGGAPFTSPLSLVTSPTLSKDPTAEDMRPETWAEKSLPFPTVAGRGPRAGGYGRGGAVVHGTSCHSVLGNEDLKHPFFGRGVRDMVARQASRLCAAGGCVVACGGVGTGAGSVEGDAAGCAEAVKNDKHADRRLATTMMLRVRHEISA